MDMILAEVNTVNASLYMVRFSEPNESFENKKFVPVVADMKKIREMVAYKNKVYISDTICSFLRQRAHASNTYSLTLIPTLLYNIELLKQATLCELALYIKNNLKRIELIAPKETSRFYNHYQTIIEPILRFCTNNEAIEATTEKNIQRTN